MTTTTRLVAFHGDPAIKAKYLARVETHRIADEIVQRYAYWKNGKGCAVGCTIHGFDHSDYECELGIPEPIAWLEDMIFEGLPAEQAKAWPSRFLVAIKPGADLSQVADRFCYWLLTSPLLRLSELADPSGKIAIASVANLYRRRLDHDEPTATEWADARNVASAVADNSIRVTARAAARAASAAASANAAWAYARYFDNDPIGGAAQLAARAAGGEIAWTFMAARLEKLLDSAPACRLG